MYYMEKMKRNLQDWVGIVTLFQALLLPARHVYCIPFYILGECPLDPGGYFVIKGTEKVILRASYI